MKSFLILLVFLSAPVWAGDLGSKAMSVGDDPVQGPISPLDKDPWPWGNECPFPWEGIDGVWQLTAAGENTPPLSSPSYLRIKVLSTSEDGSRFFQVDQLNWSGQMEAAGTGVAATKERVIYAALRDTRYGGLAFNAVIRTYKADIGASSCSESALITALSMTDHACAKGDLHYSLSPVESPKD